MRAISKYLATWAEPDATLAAAIDGRYERCLVVPACREDAAALEGYVAAARTSPGRTLVVVVVNGMQGAPAEVSAQNARFWSDAVDRLASTRELPGPPGAVLGTRADGAFDVLLVDRASAGAMLPAKTGVGLARKIGADVALSLCAAGRVGSPWIYFTDADATLPEGHFTRPELVDSSDVAAAVFPFWHDPGADGAVNRGTALHELSLRYYVRGLAYAGSPYAFHTLGSAMAVHTRAYAAVRGVPKREAGEDFYLLGKAAKVGALVRTSGPSVRLRSRASDRTPFGTGARVARGLGAFYAPECFVALRRWLAALDDFSGHGSLARLEANRGGLSGVEWDAVRAAILDARGAHGLGAAAGRARSAADLRFRAHEWFDAFRTLKFVHALRASVWSSAPWDVVRERAPFLPEAGDVDGMRRALLREETEETAARLGPGAASPATGNASR